MLERLTPRIWHMPCSQQKNRPSLGYICGDRFSLMVDAGNTPAHANEFLTALKTAGLRRPDFVVLTHSHWDHCFGLCALEMPSIACMQTRQSLEMVSRLQWTPDALEENVRAGIVPALCVPAIRENFPQMERIQVALPNVIFTDTMTLDLGNCTCLLQHVVSPHAKDTVMILIQEERMAFLGDAVYQELVGKTWIERPEKLQRLYMTLESLDFTLCQPAHQRALSKADLLEWFRRRLQKHTADS